MIAPKDITNITSSKYAIDLNNNKIIIFQLVFKKL